MGPCGAICKAVGPDMCVCDCVCVCLVPAADDVEPECKECAAVINTSSIFQTMMYAYFL